MELFITSRSALTKPLDEAKIPDIDGEPYSLPTAARDALDQLSIPDGMPFVLDATGKFEPMLSKFMLDLPTDGCASQNTWEAYGRDVITFCRFLAERCDGKAILDTTRDDIRLYYRTRLLAANGAISPVTWNRSVTSLDKFFTWAEREGLIARVPFTYNFATSKVPGDFGPKPKGRNNSLTKTGARDNIKCISFDEYLQFRNIGLLGQLPDGTRDPDFQGRNPLRNAAFAELLVTSGVRLEEGGSILRHELPNPDAARWADFRSCKMRLARLTTKGDKGRTIWIPKRLLAEHLLPYAKEDRDNSILKANEARRYAGLDDLIKVTKWRQLECVCQTRSGRPETLSYDVLRPEQRHLLFSQASKMTALDPDHPNSLEPGLLWLTENGIPMALGTHEIIFNRACRRLREFDIDLWVTPHTLRHTFAVYMLNHLIRETIGSAKELASHKGESAYRRIIADPLRTLQRMLGHASITSTYKYLTYMEEAEELVDAAVGSWSDRLGSPTDFIKDAA